MREITCRLIGILILIAVMQGCHDSSDSSSRYKEKSSALIEAETAAIEVNERQTETFNQLDAEATAAEYNYPFLRFDLGQVQVFGTYEVYRDVNEFVVFPGLIAASWDHSAWDVLEVVQSSPSKVHVVGRFSRFNSDGERYATADNLRIVTKQDGHWGIKISSSAIQSVIEEDGNASEEEIGAAESAAITVVEKYMDAFNDRDTELLSELIHYPHVLLLDVDLQLIDTAEDFITLEETAVLHDLDYAEWDHSELDNVEVLQSWTKKVHLVIQYEHRNRVGEVISAEEGIWVIVNIDGKWSIQAQSMF